MFRRLDVLRYAVLLVALLGGGTRAIAGESAEAGVRAALEAYLEGHATGSQEPFRRAFHPDAMLHGIKNGQYEKRTVAEYIGNYTGKPAPDEDRRRRRIVSIHVSDDVASAVIELEYPTMHAIDHMTLLRFPEGWKIIEKSYQATRPAAP